MGIDGQVPYLGISPDDALANMDAPIDTEGLAKIAATCRNGWNTIAGRRHVATEQKTLRRFSTWEITKYLIPVAPAHFRRVLRQNPQLPQGLTETDGGAKWFTLDEVLRLRTHFAAEGSRLRDYLPYRPPGLPAKMVTVANFKGGVGKTTTAAHLAMSAALDGYKVLVVDLDSQGSMTSIFGGQIEDKWKTVFPLIARHYGDHLRRDNQSRLDRGEAPLPLDDTVAQAIEMTTQDIVQHTHWPNIDLIGSQLDLYWSEFQLPIWRTQTRAWRLWDALSDRLEVDGVLQEYDLVVLDTPPSLGNLTINALTAADILLVPTGASFLELEATGRFFDMLHTTFASIEEAENAAAQALGHAGLSFEWDAVRAVVTRFDSGQQAEIAALMQTSLGTVLSPHRQDFTPLIGQADEQAACIYETDYRDFNREAYARGRSTFDATYAGFKRLLLGVWRRDELAAEETVSNQS
ncbi:AAA family ATPase [Ruegeria arenilitoris]|uniref:AAA family ATPase n=1 Tax=Ruegeria arenilitoris TaxID=1173585 RepID=UPI00147E5B66|nr:AAA family ATPase [Ruegeria arenilitoris]